MVFLKRQQTDKTALLTNTSSAALRKAFRDLKAKISLSMNGNGAKTIAVTSTSATDGQVSVAINLALTFAASGMRTLLVDADIDSCALATFLENIKPSATGVAAVQKNLDFLSCCKGNELPYLNKSSFAFMETLKNAYDYIIINSPSALSVADMSVITPLCDGTVLVCKKYLSSIPDVQKSLSILDIVKANVLGVIVNDNK